MRGTTTPTQIFRGLINDFGGSSSRFADPAGSANAASFQNSDGFAPLDPPQSAWRDDIPGTGLRSLDPPASSFQPAPKEFGFAQFDPPKSAQRDIVPGTGFAPYDPPRDAQQSSVQSGNALVRMRDMSVTTPAEPECSGLLNMIWDVASEYLKLEQDFGAALFDHNVARAKSTGGGYDLAIPEVPPTPNELRKYREEIQSRGPRVKGTGWPAGDLAGKSALEDMKLPTYKAAKNAEMAWNLFDESFGSGFQKWLDEQLEELMRLDRELGINHEPN